MLCNGDKKDDLVPIDFLKPTLYKTFGLIGKKVFDGKGNKVGNLISAYNGGV